MLISILESYTQEYINEFSLMIYLGDRNDPKKETQFRFGDLYSHESWADRILLSCHRIANGVSANLSYGFKSRSHKLTVGFTEVLKKVSCRLEASPISSSSSLLATTRFT